MKDSKMERKWWMPEEFFNDLYVIGDNSLTGPYIHKPMSLSERTIREVNLILELLKANPECKFLDCPCGYGRHSIELAERGFRVTGLDINRSFLQKATAKQEEKGIPDTLLNFRRGDMRYIPFEDGSFDFAINMFTSFGFFDTDEENKKVLEEFSRVLKSGGSLLIHFDYNSIRVENRGIDGENTIRELPDGKWLHVIEDYNPDTKRVEGTWKVVFEDGSNGDPFKEMSYFWRVYSPQEMRDMLSDCGFDNISILGRKDGSFQEIDEESLETFILAQKR
jgi:SAM-dependent methyltransferase